MRYLMQYRIVYRTRYLYDTISHCDIAIIYRIRYRIRYRMQYRMRYLCRNFVIIITQITRVMMTEDIVHRYRMRYHTAISYAISL